MADRNGNEAFLSNIDASIFNDSNTFGRFLVTVSETKKKKKVILISGPTDFGKSRLALELAKRLNDKIVSADSV
ncbi:hypothetical protein JHK82_031047 [Glycine max]|nr:hypothetical protein JHK85_031694 [Glycine max]KAG5124310.1 hypothetical protein JHK82_031047 [Glycine max]